MVDIDYSSIAHEIKRLVSAEDVCRNYGIEVNRMHKARCCFHNDRNPSMYIYPDGIHCFSCGAHTDIFGIVQQLTGCDFMTSMRLLIQDFNLPYSLDSVDEKRQKELDEKIRRDRLKRHMQEQEELKRELEYNKWQSIYVMYDKWLTEYEPIWPDEEPDVRYVDACKNIDYAFEMMMQCKC